VDDGRGGGAGAAAAEKSTYVAGTRPSLLLARTLTHPEPSVMNVSIIS
jgi:hypothetical protein